MKIINNLKIVENYKKNDEKCYELKRKKIIELLLHFYFLN